jgi:hypothetical protein
LNVKLLAINCQSASETFIWIIGENSVEKFFASGCLFNVLAYRKLLLCIVSFAASENET